MILPALTGLIWTLIFPTWNLSGLAWSIPAILLWSTLSGSPRQVFFKGWFPGLVHQLTTIYWLLNIPYDYTPALGWLALSAYLAIYPGIWCWCCLRLVRPDASSTIPFTGWSLARRTGFGILAALLWVGLEKLQMHFLTGFPWLYLGMSQFPIKPFIQSASIWGVAGMSFLIVWTSIAILFAMLSIRRAPGKHWQWLGDLVLPWLLVGAITIFGMQRLIKRPEPTQTIRMALIQPSIPQTVKWDEAANEAAFEKVLNLTTLAAATKPQIIIWP